MRAWTGLSAVLFLVSPIVSAQAEDACRARFIECVQQTGNPLECHAVSAACVEEMAPQAKSAALVERVEITPRNGLAYAQMTVRNASGTVQEVGVRAWGVTCPDGSRETLYFLFRNAAVSPGASLVSHQVVACFGHTSAIADENAAPLNAPQSTQVGSFACDVDGEQVVRLRVIAEATVRYDRWDGVFGTHKLRQADGADIITFVCEETTPKPKSFFAEARKRAEEALIPFMGQVMETLGLTASEFEAKYNTIGVRG